MGKKDKFKQLGFTETEKENYIRIIKNTAEETQNLDFNEKVYFENIQKTLKEIKCFFESLLRVK